MKKLSILLVSLALLASCKKSDNTPATPASPAKPVVPPSGGTFTNLFNFSATTGQNPYGSLMISGSTLYGMTSAGGANGKGNIFSIGTNGTGYKSIHDFAGGASDGASPFNDVIMINNILYGMTTYGGVNGDGVVFSMNPDGTAFTVLHSFGSSSTDGIYPQGDFVVSGNMLYATSYEGGANGNGNIFSFNLTGNVYTDIYDLKSGNGIFPSCTLVLSGGVLYGTAYLAGGAANDGTIYSYNLGTSTFTKLYTFTGGTNGANPDGSLVISGSTLYGMTNAGGANSQGIVYSISTTGTGYADLYDFTGVNGAAPYGGFIINGSTLYGMTTGGGTQAGGDVFSISTGGSGFTNIVNFGSGGSPGAFPHGSVILSSNVLYGMTNAGGQYGYGTIFSYSM